VPAPPPALVYDITRRVAAALRKAGMAGAGQAAGCAACGACSALGADSVPGADSAPEANRGTTS
jgi:hypothetical protein